MEDASMKPPRAPWEIYGTPCALPSREHVLLSEALSTCLTPAYGIGAEQVFRAWSAVEPDWLESVDREDVATMARHLHGRILRNELHAFVRPFGGGRLARSPAEDWEIDDPLRRFAWSAMDPTRPFDEEAPPTHWIVVPASQIATLPEAPRSWTRADAPPAESRPEPPVAPRRSAGPVAQRGAPPRGAEGAGPPAVAEPVPLDAFLSRKKVLDLTGFSKSTLYDKIAAGTFPAQVCLGTRMSRWRESAIAEWLRDPQ